MGCVDLESASVRSGGAGDAGHRQAFATRQSRFPGRPEGPVCSHGIDSVKQDFSFFTGSGSLEGKAADLKVEDYWYLDPLDRALDKLGRM